MKDIVFIKREYTVLSYMISIYKDILVQKIQMLEVSLWWVQWRLDLIFDDSTDSMVG